MPTSQVEALPAVLQHLMHIISIVPSQVFDSVTQPSTILSPLLHSCVLPVLVSETLQVLIEAKSRNS